MQIIKEIESIPPEFREGFVTIGNFDGIHRGHQQIFRQLLLAARHEGAPALVMTFDPHPKQVLHPERRPFYLINTPDERARILAGMGMDALCLLPFSLDFARCSAEDFIRTILWDGLRVRRIYIGHDYAFGRDKGGNEKLLRAWGRRLGFQVRAIPAVSVGGRVVSSTRIRQAILAGDVAQASACLGRFYNVAGQVIRGHGRGARLLGVPTANLAPEKNLLPRTGVYAVFAAWRGQRFPAVLSLGCNPTFGDGRLSMEVHLLDVSEDLYGERIDVLFVDRLRDERTFPGPDALVQQMHADVRLARALLQTCRTDA